MNQHENIHNHSDDDILQDHLGKLLEKEILSLNNLVLSNYSHHLYICVIKIQI